MTGQIAQEKQFTDEQIRALEKFIYVSRDATEFAKKSIIWLLRQSNGLTKRVCLSMPGEKGLEAAHGVHDMQGFNSQTHLEYFLQGMGCLFKISHHGGTYAADGKLTDKFGGGTIWFSEKEYDIGAERLQPDMDAINGLILPRGY